MWCGSMGISPCKLRFPVDEMRLLILPRASGKSLDMGDLDFGLRPFKLEPLGVDFSRIRMFLPSSVSKN